jgi:hypothetical protein
MEAVPIGKLVPGSRDHARSDLLTDVRRISNRHIEPDVVHGRITQVRKALLALCIVELSPRLGQVPIFRLEERQRIMSGERIVAEDSNRRNGYGSFTWTSRDGAKRQLN